MAIDAIPASLKDAASLLSDTGFKVTGTWYHGTSSGLIPSINKKGLKRSGDTESMNADAKTMSTIGGSVNEIIEPIFLTQSKELAYFWAVQKSNSRSRRLGKTETPTVIEINLPDALQELVKTDVGAMPILMNTEHPYLAFINDIYAANNLESPVNKLIEDPMSNPREVYLELLGLAYINKKIPGEHLSVLSA